MRRKSGDQSVIYTAQSIESDVDLIKIDIPQRIDLSPAEEQGLMARVANGDRHAFSEIVRLYMYDIQRFAFSILKDAARAEDMVQETYLRLWSKANQWMPTSRLKNWLMRITHNLCMDEIREQKGEIAVDISTLVIFDPRADQASDHADRQIAWIVKEALFALPERQRTALMLVYYQGFSNIESADIMGISVDAIESLLARGRHKLKNMLAGSKQALLEG